MTFKINTVQSLEWKTIEYSESTDTDGTLLEIQYTHEAPYRDGYLVKHVYVQYEDGEGSKEMRNESLVFCK